MTVGHHPIETTSIEPGVDGRLELAAAFDRQDLIERIGDDAGLLADLVKLFRAELPRMVRALADAATAGQPPLISRTAHALTGSLLNMGAKPAAAIARSIEARGREGRCEGVFEQLADLERELVRLEAAFSGPSAGAAGPTVTGPSARTSR